MKRKITVLIAITLIPTLLLANSEKVVSALLTHVWQKVEEVVESLPIRHVEPTEFEKIPEDEDQNSLQVTQLMFHIQMASFLKRLKEDPLSIAHRDAHAKGHGCVKGDLTVSPDLPELLTTDVLQPGQSFGTVVRFSNGSGHIQKDSQADGRGMAIKLIDALNDNGLLGDSKDQDIMMVNGQRFFIKNVSDYLKFQSTLAMGLKRGEREPEKLFLPFVLERLVRETLGENTEAQKVEQLSKIVLENRDDQTKLINEIMGYKDLSDKEKESFLIALVNLKAEKAPAELVALKEIGSETIKNPLDYSFNSHSPYLLKNKERETLAVKYNVQPVDCDSGNVIKAEEELPEGTSMKEALFARLQKQSSCFDLSLQVLDPKLPKEQSQKIVENAVSTAWSAHSQTYPVARLKLQSPSSIEEMEQGCEGISFNPWRAHASHRPLGGINRVRRFAVTGSFARRAFLNQNKGENAEE